MRPLLFQHAPFRLKLLLRLHTLNFARLLLPFEDRNSILNQLPFFRSFLDLALQFLLRVELVQLGVHLFFHHFLLNLPSFVDQLLFTFDLCA